MADFGENLRREREMRRISLIEISETTKIGVRFLDALENEEFSKLPGGIFIRSFIRSYANYLGLDPEDVIAEYQLVAPPNDEEDFSKLCVSGANPRQKRRTSVFPWIIAVFLLGGGYAIFRYAHRSSEMPLTFGNPALDAPAPAVRDNHATEDAPEPPAGKVLAREPVAAAAKNNSTTASLSGSAPRQDSAASSASPASAGTTAATTGRAKLASASAQALGSPAPGPTASSIAAAETRGELVLQLTANQPSWIAVEADGKTVFEHVLTPDNVRTLIAKNYFDVTTGNAQGTILTLNGVTLKHLGRRGEVRRLHLTRSDLPKLTP